MEQSTFNQQLLDFLWASRTPFHAVQQMKSVLVSAGYQHLKESEAWDLGASGRYFITRNDSSIIAFNWNGAAEPSQGLRLVGAHTDSPCLKVKPQPSINKHGLLQLGVEVYGGALLNPWFDRDLSIAGRIVARNPQGELVSVLVDVEAPVAVIPSLAIHLDRDANDSRKVNPQTHLPVILCDLPQNNQEDSDNNYASAVASDQGKKPAKPHDFSDILNQWLAQSRTGEAELQVVDHELFFYDTQPPAVTGFHGDYISSARLDNLLSCFVGLQALINADGSQPAMLICSDHEEIGSTSAAGANGAMLTSTLDRLYPDAEQRARVISHSLLISSDNAHAVHPNYSDRHDSNHMPQLNHGPVLKINANQRYATNAVSGAQFRDICQRSNVPLQTFVNRTDMGCGSTIGPITAAKLGITTLDVGLPTYAMHSIREMAGAKDAINFERVLRTFYNQPVGFNNLPESWARI